VKQAAQMKEMGISGKLALDKEVAKYYTYIYIHIHIYCNINNDFF